MTLSKSFSLTRCLSVLPSKDETRTYKTYKTNKRKSSLTSLVTCFILGKVYLKLTEDMPVV